MQVTFLATTAVLGSPSFLLQTGGVGVLFCLTTAERVLYNRCVKTLLICDKKFAVVDLDLHIYVDVQIKNASRIQRGVRVADGSVGSCEAG